MSDSAIIKECLVHYDNRHIQVRRDFYDLCVYDKSLFNKKVNEKGKIIRDEPNQECMAKIVRLLETLTDDARKEWYTKAINARKQGLHIPNEPEEFPIKLTYGAICTLLYNTYGESTVRNSVAVLIQWGYIQWHQATTNSIPRYILNTKRLQDALHQQAQVRLLKITPTQEDDSLAVENTPPAVVFNTQAVENTPPAVENNTNNKYYNKPFNKSLEKEKSASLREHATPSSSFANGEDDGTNNANNAPHRSDHHSSVNGVTVRVDVRDSEEVNGQSTSTENEENNRLTSPSEPLTEQNVSTDESLARIERETAERASSSAVVEPTTDAVIHVDARNTTNSYSPTTTAPSTLSETIVPTEPPTDDEIPAASEQPVQSTGKGKGKGKAEKSYETKQEDPLKVRMEEVYTHYEKIGKEMFDLPNFRTNRAWSSRTELYKAIATLLEERGSPEGMRLVFMDMWNEKDANGDYWWRDPKHLTLRALCKNYSTRLASVQFRAKQATEKLPRPQGSGSGLPNYTFGKAESAMPSPSSLPYIITPQSSPAPVEQTPRKGKLSIKRPPTRNIG